MRTTPNLHMSFSLYRKKILVGPPFEEARICAQSLPKAWRVTSPDSPSLFALRQSRVSKTHTWQADMSQSISTKHLDPIASRFLPSHFVSYFIQKNEDERSSSKIYKLSSAFSSLPTPDRLFKSVILLYSLEFSEADVRKKTMTSPRKRERADQVQVQQDPPYHVLHKLPPGDSPYVRAKHVQVFFLHLISYTCVWVEMRR